MHMSQIRKLNQVHSESYTLKIIVKTLSVFARSMLGLCSVYARFLLLALHKPYRKTFLAPIDNLSFSSQFKKQPLNLGTGQHGKHLHELQHPPACLALLLDMLQQKHLAGVFVQTCLASVHTRLAFCRIVFARRHILVPSNPLDDAQFQKLVGVRMKCR